MSGAWLTYRATKIKLAVRMGTTRDGTVRLAADYQNVRKNASKFKEAVRFAHDLGIELNLDTPDVTMTYDDGGETVSVDVRNAEAVSRAVHEMQQRALASELETNEWHGKYARMLRADSERVHPFTHRILTWRDMPCEVETALVALRERFWATRAYCTHVMHIDVGGAECRRCMAAEETIEHGLSGCSALAPTAYVGRHNGALKCLVWWLLHAYGVHETLRGWNDERTPSAVTENDRIKVWWDVPVESVHTGRAIRANRPDLRVLFKRERRLVVAEMSCPLDSNVPAKVAEKRAKYGDVIAELRTQYAEEAGSVEYAVLVIGALGRVDKGSLLEGLRIVVGKEREGEVERIAERMQKAVVTSSVNIAKSYFRLPARRG